MTGRRLAAALIILAVPLTAGGRPLSSPAEIASTSTLEREIFNLINVHRRAIGKSDLAWNETIPGIARVHSQDIADGKIPFGHNGFEARAAQIRRAIPWAAVAEVVALTDSAAATVDGWIRSAEHRIYIEGDFALAGVGVALNRSGPGFYATAILVKPRS